MRPAVASPTLTKTYLDNIACEISLIDVKAQVMTYDESVKKWIPSGSGEPSLSKVQLFKHQQNNTFRIVARKIADKEVVINCALVKGMRYNRATGTFHQWRDVRQVYGLNFANVEEASNFGDAVQDSLDSSSKPQVSQSPSSVNGDNTMELERERQRQLEEQREQERLSRAKEAEEEAERRRVREERLRKEKEEQTRLDKERREKDELQERLAVQRRKQQEEEQQRLEETERIMEQRVAEKQRELDEMRAMEARAQEDLQNKAIASPRRTAKREDTMETNNIPPPLTGNAFGVALRSPATAKKESVPSSLQQYEEQIRNDIEAEALPPPPRAPSPVYNIPTPPPDIPSSPNIQRNKLVTQLTSLQSASQITKTKSVPSQKSQSQDNLMDEIQRKLAARKRLTEMNTDDSPDRESTNTTPPSNNNKFISPSINLPTRTNQPSSLVKKQSEPNKANANPSASVSPFRQSTVIDKKEKNEVTSEELQALKTEILKDIKVELERTKQEILAEIRKELARR